MPLHPRNAVTPVSAHPRNAAAPPPPPRNAAAPAPLRATPANCAWPGARRWTWLRCWHFLPAGSCTAWSGCCRTAPARSCGAPCGWRPAAPGSPGRSSAGSAPASMAAAICCCCRPAIACTRCFHSLSLPSAPAAINAVLHPHFPQGDGLRLPGAFDGFELAVRAVLGQQVTLAAARTLGQRLVQRLGQTNPPPPHPPPPPGPNPRRLSPPPATLAATDGAVLGQMGIVRQRQAAIVALARAVDGGQLALHDGADLEKTTAALCALPGIGDWTAQYIARRVLRWPDAFPSGDVALHKALGLQGQKNPARAATAAAQALRPLRRYALLRARAGAPPRA